MSHYLSIASLLLIPLLVGCHTSPLRPSSGVQQRPPSLESPSASNPSNSLSPTLSVPPHRSAKLWYQIHISPHIIHVAARIIQPVYLQSRFYLPSQKNWHFSSKDYPPLTDFRATSASPPSELDLEITPRNSDPFVTIYNNKLPYFDFSYSLDTPSPNPNTTGILLLGPTFLAVPSKELLDSSSNILIEVVAPSSFLVASTWTQVSSTPSITPGHTVHGFITKSAKELRDSFIFFGPRISLMTLPPNIQLAFDPFLSPDHQSYIAHKFSALAHYYSNLFGNLSSITGLFLQQRRSPSLPEGMGRLHGFMVQLSSPSRITSPEFLLLLAHEAMHMWNGHLLAPNPNDPNLSWFVEGFTEYIALKSAYQLHWISFEQLTLAIQHAASLFHVYPADSPHLASPSQTERFPYDHGLLLSFAIDCALHQASPHNTLHKHAIEAWFLTFLQEQQERPYREQDLFQSLQHFLHSHGIHPQLADQIKRQAHYPSSLSTERLLHRCL